MNKIGIILLLLFTSHIAYAQEQDEWNIVLRSKFDIVSSKNTKKVKLIIAIPQSREHKQVVEDVSFSIQPERIFEQDGCKYAEFIINEPWEKEYIWMLVSMKLLQCNLKTMKKLKTKITKPDSLDKYLKSELNMEKDDDLVQAKAAELKASNEIKTIENIFNFINRNITYSRVGYVSMGARYTLETKTGKCSETAELFVALCRACSIPARYIVGHRIDAQVPVGHAWAEAYLDEIGWIPFDPTPSINKGKKKRWRKFNELYNEYIYISDIRNNNVLHNGFIFSYQYSGGKSTVTHNVTIRSRD